MKRTYSAVKLNKVAILLTRYRSATYRISKLFHCKEMLLITLLLVCNFQFAENKFLGIERPS